MTKVFLILLACAVLHATGSAQVIQQHDTTLLSVNEKFKLYCVYDFEAVMDGNYYDLFWVKHKFIVHDSEKKRLIYSSPEYLVESPSSDDHTSYLPLQADYIPSDNSLLLNYIRENGNRIYYLKTIDGAYADSLTYLKKNSESYWRYNLYAKDRLLVVPSSTGNELNIFELNGRLRLKQSVSFDVGKFKPLQHGFTWRYSSGRQLVVLGKIKDSIALIWKMTDIRTPKPEFVDTAKCCDIIVGETDKIVYWKRNDASFLSIMELNLSTGAVVEKYKTLLRNKEIRSIISTEVVADSLYGVQYVDQFGLPWVKVIDVVTGFTLEKTKLHEDWYPAEISLIYDDILNKRSEDQLREHPPAFAVDNLQKNGSLKATTNYLTLNGRFDIPGWERIFLVNGKRHYPSPTGRFSVILDLNEVRNEMVRLQVTDEFDNEIRLKIPVEKAEPTNIRGKQEDVKMKASEMAQASRNFALLIAETKYDDGELLYPELNAVQLRQALLTYYSFDSSNVFYLPNAKRSEIFDVFEHLDTILQTNDQLLIYYAGHGFYDARRDRGYWLPSDYSSGSRDNWISNSDITDFICNTKALHVLTLSDACFSGSLITSKTRNASKKKNRLNETIEFYSLFTRRSVQAITSGALETVPDKSVFSSMLINILSANRETYLSAYDLSVQLLKPVRSATLKAPQYGTLTNHLGGEFFFIRKGQY